VVGGWRGKAMTVLSAVFSEKLCKSAATHQATSSLASQQHTKQYQALLDCVQTARNSSLIFLTHSFNVIIASAVCNARRDRISALNAHFSTHLQLVVTCSEFCMCVFLLCKSIAFSLQRATQSIAPVDGK
jgi:hypothetical protein